MPKRTLTKFAIAGFMLAASASALAKAPATSKQAPLKKARNSHAPFEAGTCDLCHQSARPSKPGALKKSEPELCLDCHNQFGARLKKYKHRHEATDTCSACHNPHNGDRRLFLLAAGAGLCLGCHELDTARHPMAKVTSSDRACIACHNPHGSNKKHLKQAIK